MHRSTKAIRARNSIYQQSRYKLRETLGKRNSNSNSLESVHGDVKGNYCKNHSSRTAMHQVDFQTTQYFCLECSLLYAKQGYKIKAIQIANVDNDRINRQKQTSQYLQKCSIMQGQIMNWRREENVCIGGIYEEFEKLIKNQRQKMEYQLNKIREIYGNFIQNLEDIKEERLKKLRDNSMKVEKISKNIQKMKKDIQQNYEDCIKSFNLNQFRSVMDEYWKQMKSAQSFLTQNSIANFIKKQQMDMKNSIRTMQRSDNTSNDFTFSKERKFETPPFCKEIRDIKFAESQPDSNRYSSSLKQSIVDSKINFNDINL